MEHVLGRVIHWYNKIGVAVVHLSAPIKVGDAIKVRHGDSETEETISSMEVDHQSVTSAKKGDEVAIKLAHKAKEDSLICATE